MRTAIEVLNDDLKGKKDKVDRTKRDLVKSTLRLLDAPLFVETNPVHSRVILEALGVAHFSIVNDRRVQEIRDTFEDWIDEDIRPDDAHDAILPIMREFRLTLDYVAQVTSARSESPTEESDPKSSTASRRSTMSTNASVALQQSNIAPQRSSTAPADLSTVIEAEGTEMIIHREARHIARNGRDIHLAAHRTAIPSGNYSTIERRRNTRQEIWGHSETHTGGTLHL